MPLDPRAQRGLALSVSGSLIGTGIFVGITALFGATHRAFDVVLFGLLLVCLLIIGNLAARLRTVRGSTKELATTRSRMEVLTAELEALEKWRDLEAVTGLESFREALSKSEMHPREALDRIRISLDFMGHGASKWSAQSDQMASMLLRLTDHGIAGCARILILDPQSGVCRDTSRIRFPDDPNCLPRKIASSLMELEQLVKAHDNLEVRLYTHRPAFRITIIDHQYVVAGHYLNYQHGSEATPLLVIRAEPDWSFFSPFQVLFDAEWRAAERVSWNNIRAFAETLDVYAR